MMMKPITEKDIQRLHSSQRRQRNCASDDHRGLYTVVPFKVRKKHPIPTDREQSELLQAAIENRRTRRSHFQVRSELQEKRQIFERRQAHHLHALNPFAGARWAGLLEQAITATAGSESLWFVTIIDDDWTLATYPVGPSEGEFRQVLCRMRSAARKTLRGVPYLLAADFALRRYVGNSSTHLEIHWHGFLWADIDTINRLGRKFQINALGAPCFVAEPVYDLGGALGYATKDSLLGYVTVENHKFQPESCRWKRWFHHREALTGPKRRLVMNAIGELTKPKLCAASGVGRDVLRDAKQRAEAQGYGASSVSARARAVRSRLRRR